MESMRVENTQLEDNRYLIYYKFTEDLLLTEEDEIKKEEEKSCQK